MTISKIIWKKEESNLKIFLLSPLSLHTLVGTSSEAKEVISALTGMLIKTQTVILKYYLIK